MKPCSDKQNRLGSFVELDDQKLSLADIESIATDEKTQKRFEKAYEGCLYTTILLSLTHELFEEPEARIMWDDIIAHMKQLNQILGRNVGVSVASLDYLTNIKNKLSEPKIIEEDKSNFITDATTKDELTGLYLREVFDVFLMKEMEEAGRKNAVLCLMMIDIDDFKAINDTLGHLAGDDVLRKIGGVVNASVREMDMAARYGGEEIAVIMPGAGTAQAFRAAQRIREGIERISFDEIRTTVSIGIGQNGPDVESPEKLIHAADMALYEAKKSGKNQVIVADTTN